MTATPKESSLEIEIVPLSESWCLKHEPQKDDTRPFLKRFAEDFEFDVIRKGGPRRVVDSQWGPDLAHVSIWYWDEGGGLLWKRSQGIHAA